MADDDYDEMKREVMGAVAENFRPEFINRIDESVVFHPLGADNIRAIAKIQLAGLAERLEERELTLEISDAGIRAAVSRWVRSGIWCAALEARYSAIG
jgi:ATP-dependent Clp protease ATP-binding subunit ClpB